MATVLSWEQLAALSLVLTSCSGEPLKQVGNANYPNEPAGSQVLIDWDFDISGARNPPWNFKVGAPPATTVTDATAPVDPNKVGRIQFDPSLPGGTGPSELGSLLVPPSNWKTWYHSMWVKASANYKNEMGFPGLKIWDMFYSEGNGSIIFQFYGARAPFVTMLTVKGGPGSGLDHFGTIAMQATTWYHFELLATKGSSNTRYQVFVNGVPDLDFTDATVSNVQFDYGWIMGGGLPGQDFVTITSYMYMDHIRFSYAM